MIEKTGGGPASRFELAFQLGRHLGPGWMAYRAWYALQNQLGLLRRRLPAHPWDALPLAGLVQKDIPAESDAYLAYRRAHTGRFLFASSDRKTFQEYFVRWQEGDAALVARAQALAEGRLTYFSGKVLETGFPPHWHRNAIEGQVAPDDVHWTQLDEYAFGDIKVIWEPSRFSFAYDLVRLYWRTGDERWPELFWQLVESWREGNPPQLGPNWRCGQETAIRLLAWCFGMYGFMENPATTASRVADLAQMMAVSGRRIEANLGYALSQRNNHSISEPVGLWTLGLLFPEFVDAARWRQKGRQALERQSASLFYSDGGFAQHSFNYERLAVHALLWALSLGEANDQPLDRSVYDAVTRAAVLLHAVQDADGGWLPRYGHDDGALILPLSHCSYDDFRPVIQAASVTGSGIRCCDDGPWNEDLLWLRGPQSLRTPLSRTIRTDLDASQSGCYVVRTAEGFAFSRCPQQFYHRPGQADVLHVDIGWRGLNIAVDAGTYSYNASPPWDDLPLAGTTHHNTVTVDGRDQMDHRGRYLWLPWLHGASRAPVRWQDGTMAYWEGLHDGYQRLPAPVSHRRGVLHLGDEHWLIVDELKSRGPHLFRLHWLFSDWPYEWDAQTGKLTLRTLEGSYYVQLMAVDHTLNSSLVRAAADSPRGWLAPRYQLLEPALSLAGTVQASSARFVSCLGPSACKLVSTGPWLEVQAAGWSANVRWSEDPEAALVAMATRQPDLAPNPTTPVALSPF